MTSTKSNSKSIKLALTAIFLWSTVATAFKIALSFVNWQTLLIASCFFSFISILFYILFTSGFSSTIKTNSKILIYAALFGFLNPFLYYSLLFNAYSLSPAQEALTLNYFWGVAIVLLSIPILKAKPNFIELLGVLISFFGVIIIANRGSLWSINFSNALGSVYAILSAFVWAFYWLISKKLNNDTPQFMLFSSLFGLIFSLAIYHNSMNINILTPNIFKIFSSLSYIGFFEMGITFLIWQKAIKISHRPGNISSLSYLSPFLSLFWISIFLKEKISISTIIGFLFILLGILIGKYEFELKKKINQ